MRLVGLRGVVDRIGQEPTDRPDELFDAVAVAFQDWVLEVERQMTSRGGSPILALGRPIARRQGDPVLGDGNRFDRPGFSRAGCAADVQLGLGSEIGSDSCRAVDPLGCGGFCDLAV